MWHFFKAQLSRLISWGLLSAAVATAPRTDTARSSLAAGPEHSNAPVCVLASWLRTPDLAAEKVQCLHLAPSPAAGRLEAFAVPAWTWEREALCAAEDRDTGWGLMRKDASSSANRRPLTPSSPDSRCWCWCSACSAKAHGRHHPPVRSTDLISQTPIQVSTGGSKIDEDFSSHIFSGSILILPDFGQSKVMFAPFSFPSRLCRGRKETIILAVRLEPEVLGHSCSICSRRPRRQALLIPCRSSHQML